MRFADRLFRPQSALQLPFWEREARMPVPLSTAYRDREQIETDFGSYVHRAAKDNGVVFACMLVRLLVFSEARFLWRRYEGGRPQRPFGDASLELLERPWPNGTTGELLAHMDQDVSLAGNFFAAVVEDRGERWLRRLRPDWVTILTASRSGDPTALDARPVGYVYDPRRQHGRGEEPEVLEPERVVHYSPIPDPAAQWRGMSWLTPVMREVESDTEATRHKRNFFRRGATPGYTISYDKTVKPAEVREYAELFREQHEGTDNAYRTLHLGGGAEPKTVGTSLRELDFKTTQGAGETRIIMAAGLHPVVVGASEGLEGSSLNAGNFQSARRRVADGTFRPLWRIAAASLERVLDGPSGAHLWYDDRDVAFLRDDTADEAKVRQTNASTITQLINAGFDAESAVRAVESGDFNLLEHTGLVSVQLQPPGEGDPVGVPANLAPRLLAQGWRHADTTETGAAA